ncbi:MAG: TIGR03936 family radical SAM-associated protein [Oscillospiraceae bacterium]|nr:TIGR03936 family radical SAM-associated protein [Oscillospiraceae bacterium]
MSDKLRLRFSKTGRAVYISHLDLMQTMQRAFSRAGLPLRYSEGFNPHPLISVALPLSVGTASVCELMDFRLRDETDPAGIAERLTAALPEGIEALEVYEPERKSALIKWLLVEGRFDYDERDPAEAAAALRDFYGRESILIEKKTKRGVGMTELRPHIRELRFTPLERAVLVEAKVSAQEPTVNPELLAEALRQLAPGLAPDFACFRRIETFDADGKVFR